MSDVIKVATAGSVDDGKSTLIGRLLYETGSLPQDKLDAIKKSSERKGLAHLDLSLATDGLLAERDQGITIDVAHLYFSTNNKSYIIADSPGHVQYTRNMITGASTSDIALILIDARHGVTDQTRLHLSIAHLMRMRRVVVAINKMDLVDYQETVFQECKDALLQAAAQLNQHAPDFIFVPTSALAGHGITQWTQATPWHTGPTILEAISIPLAQSDMGIQHLFVQSSIRPQRDEFRDYRGYTGTVQGGAIAIGSELHLNGLEEGKVVKSLHVGRTQYEELPAGTALALELQEDVNVNRGDILHTASELIRRTKSITAQICWMQESPLQPGQLLLMQHGTARFKVKVDSEGEIQLNDIANLSLRLSQERAFCTYDDDRALGRFILIDPLTNNTAGVGFVRSLE